MESINAAHRGAAGDRHKATQAGAAFLRDFVEEAKASGSRLIERQRVRGLSVAPPV